MTSFGGVKKAKSMPNSGQASKKNGQLAGSKTQHQIALDAASAASRISFIEKGSGLGNPHNPHNPARKNGPGIVPNIVFRPSPRLIEELLEEDMEDGQCSEDESSHKSKDGKYGKTGKGDTPEYGEARECDEDDECDQGGAEKLEFIDPPRPTKEERRKAAIARTRLPQNIKFQAEPAAPQLASAPLFRVLASFLVKLRIMELKKQKSRS